jgi:hypothetical protein
MFKVLGLRGYDAGGRLKAISGWRPGIPGTDNFGFTALPGGEHLSRFYAAGDTHPKSMGFSVRCVKDNQDLNINATTGN